MEEDLIPHDFLLSPEMFSSLFYTSGIPTNLSSLALEGALSSIHNRFISWRVFLGIFSREGPIESWISTIEDLRLQYSKLQDSQSVLSNQRFSMDNLDPLIHNPLSPASEVTPIQNPWNSFHMNNQLQEVIRLDIERTNQDKPLFLLQEVQDIMLRILFLWAKLNPEISYKQGMNELLGVLVFVGYADLPVLPLSLSNAAAEALQKLNNKQHLEADLFWCFTKIMDLGIKELFNPVVAHRHIKKPDLFTWDAEKNKNDLVGSDKSQSDNVSYILRRSHRIHHQILQKVDPAIYKCLEKNQIEPQMYLQRWLRCMLTREFGTSDCLHLWDAVLADYSLKPENELELLDFLCVAMIVFVKGFSKM